MELSEIRGWIQFFFLVVGGVVGLTAFCQNMRQRKIENSLKMTKWFHDSIDKEDISNWERLFYMSSESAGAQWGFYIAEGKQQPLSDYFSEGSPDAGALGRIADCLNVICHEMVEGTVDPRFIWFEFGQLLRTIHGWIGAIEAPSGNGTLLEEAFPSFNKAFQRYEKCFNKWPSRTYAYAE